MKAALLLTLFLLVACESNHYKRTCTPPSFKCSINARWSDMAYDY